MQLRPRRTRCDTVYRRAPSWIDGWACAHNRGRLIAFSELFDFCDRNDLCSVFHFAPLTIHIRESFRKTDFCDAALTTVRTITACFFRELEHFSHNVELVNFRVPVPPIAEFILPTEMGIRDSSLAIAPILSLVQMPIDVSHRIVAQDVVERRCS